MSAGLFALNCPYCGTELQVDHVGTGSCVACGQIFLSRFGHLIPIDPTATRTVARPLKVVG